MSKRIHLDPARIQGMMSQREMSIPELAEKSRIDIRSIRRALDASASENGVNWQTARALAKALEVEIGQLVTDSQRFSIVNVRSEVQVRLAETSRELADCRTVKDVLSALWRKLGTYSLVSIRYYRFERGVDRAQDRLVSVDSVGNSDDVSRDFRSGEHRKTRGRDESAALDAFEAINLGRPMLCVVDPKSPYAGLPSRDANGILTLTFKVDPCKDLFGDRKSHRWVDFPLTCAGVILGKFSCDIAEDGNLAAAMRFQEMADLSLAALQAIAKRESERIDAPGFPATAIREAISSCRTSEDLFIYCTDVLPRYFDCRFASIFTTLLDSLGYEQLILRKTAYPKSQRFENIGAYKLYDQSSKPLTTWVARWRTPLRLRDLQVADRLARQLRSYGSDAVWSLPLTVEKDRDEAEQRVQPRESGSTGRAGEGASQTDRCSIVDSDTHTSYLAVPILDHERLLGVIRFTDKTISPSGDYFTPDDERRLVWVATFIAKKLMELMHTEQLRRIAGAATTLETLSRETPARDPHAVLLDALEHLFPQAFDARRLYLANEIHFRDPRYVLMIRASRGLLQLDDKGTLHDLEFTLTNRAFRLARMSDNAGTAYFVGDVEMAEKHDAIKQIAKGAKCAVACAVLSDGNMTDLHDVPPLVLIIESERFDLDPVIDAQLLAIFCRWVRGWWIRHIKCHPS